MAISVNFPNTEQSAGKKRLNLGAGEDILEGWVNLDKYNFPGIGVIHDLENGPLPFQDDTFELIRAVFILEHLANPSTLIEEIYRVGCHKGRVEIAVPYWNSLCFIKDITHRRGFHEQNFRMLDPILENQKWFYPNCSFHLEKIGLFIFEKHIEVWQPGLVKFFLKLAPYIPHIVRDLLIVLRIDKGMKRGK